MLSLLQVNLKFYHRLDLINSIKFKGGVAVSMGSAGLVTGSVGGAMIGGGTVLIGEPIKNAIERERVDYPGLGKRALGGAIAGGIIGGAREC